METLTVFSHPNDWPFVSSTSPEPINAQPEAVIPASTPARPKRTRKPAQSIAAADFVGPPAPPPPTPEFPPLPVVTQTDKTLLGGYTIGIELTAMPDLSEKERNSFGSSAANYQANLVQKLLAFKKLSVNEVHRDVEAVEVSTNPLKTWGEVKKNYDTITDAFTRFGLVPHVMDTISGGGHIHVGGLAVRDQVNILRDIQNRPYLNWVFNDPDDKTTRSYAADLEDMSAKLKKLAPTVDLDTIKAFGKISDQGQSALLFYGDASKANIEWFPDDKSRMVRAKYHGDWSSDKVKPDKYTLEFRFFQTPVDWDEQQAHLEFVLRYIEYVKQTYKDKPVELVLDTQAKVKGMTEEQAVTEFRKLLVELKLPEKPYERMLLENIPVWYERGQRG